MRNNDDDDMTTLRSFTCDDLFTYNAVNTDVLTEVGRCKLNKSLRPRVESARYQLLESTSLSKLWFQRTNLRPYTETFNLNFYMQYLAKWPEYFVAAVRAGGAG